MEMYPFARRGSRAFRVAVLFILVFTLSFGGGAGGYAAPAETAAHSSLASRFEAQASPLYAQSLTTAVERFNTKAASSRPALTGGVGAVKPSGDVHANMTYEYTCIGSMTCFGATCGLPTCIGSTCIACSPTYATTCGSTCNSTCSSTCNSTCNYTCASTCANTCGTTCSGVTCAVTCGAKCDDPIPPTGVGFDRLSGTDRYATAVAISQVAFPDGAPGVVITTGKKFPDALAGASLAYVTGPLLLVGDTMPQVVKDEITRLNPSRAIILGEPDVVSVAIENYLKTQVDTTTRIGGVDRYATAALIARQTAQAYGGIPSKTAIIATGLNFPDALAAAPMSAKQGMPILLVRKDYMPGVTREMLTELGITKTIILGDVTAINASVASQLPSPTRLGGLTRYETMGKIVDYAWTNYGMGAEYLALAIGTNFPDALAGGAVAGGWNGAILLTPGNALHAQAASRITRAGGQLQWLDVYGGKDVLYPSVVTSAFNCLP